MKLEIKTGPQLYFDKVGRNKATTFTGLCDTHDSELFDPIDNSPFKSTNIEHLFLLAYRSVLRELHTKMKGAVDIQTQYNRGVEMGKFNPAISDEASNMAITNIAESYTFYLHKFHYDQLYIQKNFAGIEHHIQFIEDIQPSVAVSSVYSYTDNMRYYNDRIEPKCISLNVFPQDSGIFLIFSFRKEHSSRLLPFISPILDAERHYKLYLLSKLILMHCENFVLSPFFYQTLSQERIKAICDFFMKNLYIKKEDTENGNLLLFY
ncbi:MAG: hypothetical protein WA610_07680 [Thermodesulfovibrionales bacterium]